MIQIDKKLTIWERFQLDDDMREPLEAFMQQHPQADFLEIYDWAYANGCDPETEYIEGTTEYLEAEDNGGAETLEIMQNNKIFLSK